MVLIAHGNPFDGLQFCGPFDDADSASAYGERNFQGDWWIVPLTAPVQGSVIGH
jgi:hypothetical protein